MKNLIVDANCFIEMFSSLQTLIGKYRILTSKKVYNEITDQKTIQNLQLFLPDLATFEPSKESVSRVIKFAKETGDINALSIQDIELIALAIDFLKEQGTD